MFNNRLPIYFWNYISCLIPLLSWNMTNIFISIKIKLYRNLYYWFIPIYSYLNIFNLGTLGCALDKDLGMLKNLFVVAAAGVESYSTRPLKLRTSLRLYYFIKNMRAHYGLFTNKARLKRQTQFGKIYLVPYILDCSLKLWSRRYLYNNICRLPNSSLAVFPYSYMVAHSLLSEMYLVSTVKNSSYDLNRAIEFDFYTHTLCIYKSLLNYCSLGVVMFIYLYWSCYNTYNWYHYY